MKTINYANYNNNKFFYNEVKGTYNSEDNTIKVYDRKVMEFDYKLDDGSKVHLKLINKNFEGANSKFNQYFKYINTMEEEFDYSDCFFYTTDKNLYFEELNASLALIDFYRDNKEVLDKLIKEETGYDTYFDGLTLKQKIKCFNVIEEVYFDLFSINKFDTVSYEDILKKLEEKEIFNMKVYDPDADGLN